MIITVVFRDGTHTSPGRRRPDEFDYTQLVDDIAWGRIHKKWTIGGATFDVGDIDHLQIRL